MTTVIAFPDRGRDDEAPKKVEAPAPTDVAPPPRRLPSKQRMAALARYRAKKMVRAVPELPVKAVKEIPTIGRGTVVALDRWSSWVHCSELAEAIKQAEGNERSKAQERLVVRRKARAWSSVGVVTGLAGGATWLYFLDPLFLGPLGLATAAVLDVVGRRAKPKPDNPLPMASTDPWNDPGVPLHQLTRTIIDALERQGFPEGTVSVSQGMWVEEQRMERRVRIRTADEIEPKHIRAIEIALGAPNGTIRNLATESAAVRELVMPYGDPLKVVPKPPALEPGSLSIADPLEIGVSATDVPFALTFAGTHIAVVGSTGSGKTKGVLWAMIDRISACRDAVLWGIDLTNGPALPMWRGVFQERAKTPEEADELLDKALAEIDRRMQVLTDIAEDDDPDNDTDEWHSGLGPALILLVDEFAIAAEYDGTKGRVNLRGKFEQIVRTGRKVWVSLVIGTQKAGNSDFGSTVLSTQLGAKILLACDDKSVSQLLSGDARDQGWRPDLLMPSVEGDVRDAGKCYVLSPAHRTPDIYRAFAPLSSAEVKRRARERVEAGLPNLLGRPHGYVEDVELPEVLEKVRAAFARTGNPAGLNTTKLLTELAAEGYGTTPKALATALRPYEVQPVKLDATTRGYRLADVERAIAALKERS